MKLPCEAVQDLLILYDDDACSEATRKMVEEHLAECENCREHTLPTMFPVKEEGSASLKEMNAVKRGFKRTRNRLIAGVLTVLMLFPLSAVGVLGYNELNGKGKALSNWDEIDAGEEFLEALAEGDYEDAVEYITFHSEYEEAKRQSELTLEEFIDETYGVDYIEFTVDGEPWVVDTQRYQTLTTFTLDPDQLEIDWEWLIYDPTNDACIPEKIFQEVTGVTDLTVNSDGISTVRVKGEYWDPVTYCRLETKWGTFMMREDQWEFLQSNTANGSAPLDPENLGHPFVVPKSLYLDTVEAIKEINRSEYEWRVEDYSKMVEAGEEAFSAEAAEFYLTMLTKLKESSFALTDITYDSSYRINGQWWISYYATLQLSKSSHTIRFDFETYDGKVYCRNVSGTGSEKLAECLTRNYIPTLEGTVALQ